MPIGTETCQGLSRMRRALTNDAQWVLMSQWQARSGIKTPVAYRPAARLRLRGALQAHGEREAQYRDCFGMLLYRMGSHSKAFGDDSIRSAVTYVR